MLKKDLLIDIYDADTLLMFGTCRVNLKDVLRQQKRESNVMKDVDIISCELNRVKGSLGV